MLVCSREEGRHPIADQLLICPDIKLFPYTTPVAYREGKALN